MMAESDTNIMFLTNLLKNDQKQADAEYYVLSFLNTLSTFLKILTFQLLEIKMLKTILQSLEKKFAIQLKMYIFNINTF